MTNNIYQSKKSNNLLYTKVENKSRVKVWMRVVSGLSAVAVFCVTYAMIIPALTLEAAVACGLTDHIHAPECFVEVPTLICGMEEIPASAGHTHTDSCYASALICDLPETEGHTHSELCLDAEGNAVCGLEEAAGHIHTSECYINELICGLEESQAVSGHVHSESCYMIEHVQICALAEHMHSAECYIHGDPNADVETAEAWETDIITAGITGAAANDVVTIARTQLEKRESARNYIEDETGRRSGWNRFGAAFGDPYGEIGVMFARFCYKYAGIELPQVQNAAELASLVRIVDQPSAGDIVFLRDETGAIVCAGIFAGYSVNNEYTVIETLTGVVREMNYSADDQAIAGFGAPENMERPAAETAETVIPSSEPIAPEMPSIDQTTYSYGETVDPDIPVMPTAAEDTTTAESTTAESTTAYETAASETTTSDETAVETTTAETTAEETTTSPETTTQSETSASEPVMPVAETTTARETTASQETTTSEETTTSQETTTSVETTTSTETTTSQETTTSVETTTSEETTTSQETTTSVETTTSEETTTSQETTTSVETTTSEETTASAETTTSEETTTSQETTSSEETTTSVETTTAEETTSPDETTADTTETEPEPEYIAPEMPAQKFVYEIGDVTIKAFADEGSFPAGTTMSVAEVSEQSVIDTVTGAVDGEIVGIKAFDITFFAESGDDLEPEKPVRVKIISNIPTVSDNQTVVHVENDGSAKVVDQSDEITVPSAAEEIVFDAGGFSVYAIVYTVDFHNDGIEFSIDGGTSISLRELAVKIGLIDDILEADDFIAGIGNVEFSNPELVKVTHKTKVLWVFGEEDWVLESLMPFDTEEKLTITLKSGDVIEIRVTDAQITKDFITASGETYTITVIYGEDAGIPEGAELRVREIAEESDEYTYYFDQTIATLSDGAAEEYVVGLDHARFFDVSIIDKDGDEIEPTTPVDVKITYAEPVELSAAAELKVIHFAQNGTEIINIETEEESVSEITYEQNGFSVIGTVAETNAYGWPTAENTPYVMLLQDGADYYAVAHDGTLRKVYYLNGTVSFMGPGTTSMDYLDEYLWSYSIVSASRHTARLSAYGTDTASYIDPYFGILPQNTGTPDAVIGSAQRTLSISNGKIYANYYNTSYTLSAEGGILHRTTLNADDASPVYFAGITSFTADTSESEMYDFIDIKVLIEKWKTEMTQDLIVDKTAEVYDYSNRIYQLDLMASSGYHLVSPALALEFVVDASRSMFFPENLHRVQVNGSDYTYSNMSGLRSFFNRLDESQRNTVFYVITDKDNAATNWAVFYHDASRLTAYKDGRALASGWYYIDASYFYAPDNYERNYPTTGQYCNPLSSATLSNLNDGYIYTADEKVEGRPWSRLDYMQIAVEAASEVLFSVDPDAQIGLVTFNKNTHSYGPFTAAQKDNMISALYNIDLDGGTRHADGLNKAVSEFNTKFNNVKNSQTAVVLITDGAPNGNTWPQIQTAASSVKSMKNAFGQNTRLFTLGLSLENVGENKDKLAAISSEPHSDFSFSAEKSTDVVNFITKIIEGLIIDADLIGSVTDVIDAGFYPVDPESGLPLESGTWINGDGKVTSANSEDAAGQVINTDGIWKVEWKDLRIDWPTYTDSTKTEVLYHGWNGRVYVKAQEDFLGGNDIPTNAAGSQVEALHYINRKTGEVKNISGEDAERIKAFNTPYVNVDELSFDENGTEWTVYLGETVDSKEQLQKLIEAINVYEVVKDDGSLIYEVIPQNESNLSGDDKDRTGKTFPLSAVINGLTEEDWATLISGKTAEIDYEAYGHTPGAITVSLTQTVKEGEDDLTNNPHTTSVTGDDVEKYELTVAYAPFAPSVADYHTGNFGSGSHGADTDDIISVNSHKINVFAKKMKIEKVDQNRQLITDDSATFVLYRKATADEENDNTVTKYGSFGNLPGTYVAVQTLTTDGGTVTTDPLPLLADNEAYYLVETKAPAGYNTLAEPLMVTIDMTDHNTWTKLFDGTTSQEKPDPYELSDWLQEAEIKLWNLDGTEYAPATESTYDHTDDTADASVTYKIINISGYTLPSTGGSGTHLFTILGIVLILGAGITLWMRRRAV